MVNQKEQNRKREKDKANYKNMPNKRIDIPSCWYVACRALLLGVFNCCVCGRRWHAVYTSIAFIAWKIGRHVHKIFYQKEI